MQVKFKRFKTHNGKRYVFHLEAIALVYDDERELFEHYDYWEHDLVRKGGSRNPVEDTEGIDGVDGLGRIWASYIYEGRVFTSLYMNQLDQVEEWITKGFQRIINHLREAERYDGVERVIEISETKVDVSAEG